MYIESIGADENPRIKRPATAGQLMAAKSSEETVATTGQNPFEVCNKCLSLNLPGLLRSFTQCDEGARLEPWSRWGVAVTHIGFEYRSPDPTCTMCQILCASRTDLEYDALRSIDWGEKLIAILIDSAASELYGLPRSQQIVVGLVICPASPSSPPVDVVIRHAMAMGLATMFANTVQPTILMPRAVPRVFDPNTAKSWLQHCRDSHHETCEMKLLPVYRANVIDCTTTTIVECCADTSYVALSYVWGATENASALVRVTEGRRLILHKLPAIVQDAIEVTKMLGFRYLWIDKYCIDQDKPDLKHDQICQMDAIYRNAELTIIGAAGVDQNYGLPGVGIRARSRQPRIEIEGVTAMWTPKDPRKAIAQSRWCTRGWTFQEAFLSRRRLVFTDDQVYFECGTTNYLESVDCNGAEIHIGRETVKRPLREGIFSKKPGGLFRTYVSSVKEYTTRELRFDEDSLNAFRGILREFARHLEPLGNVWGLCFPLRKRISQDYFAFALTWAHLEVSKKPRRRPGFPSWAWAGWAGPAEYVSTGFRGKYKHESGRLTFKSNLRKVRFKASDHDSFELMDLAQEDKYPILHAKAALVPMVATVSRSTDDVTEYIWRVALERRQLMYKIEMWDPRVTLCWSADAATYRAFCANSTDKARWNCILIGRDKEDSYVIVLEAVSGTETWQRVGMFRIPLSDFAIEPQLNEEMYHTYNIV